MYMGSCTQQNIHTLTRFKQTISIINSKRTHTTPTTAACTDATAATISPLGADVARICAPLRAGGEEEEGTADAEKVPKGEAVCVLPLVDDIRAAISRETIVRTLLLRDSRLFFLGNQGCLSPSSALAELRIKLAAAAAAAALPDRNPPDDVPECSF